MSDFEAREDQFDPSVDAHQTPDPEYVEGLMRCVQTSIHAPSDMRRVEEDLPSTVLEGCVRRNPDDFFPPKRLLEDGGRTVRQGQILMWRHIVDTLLWEAQKSAFTDANIAALQVDGVNLRNPRKGFSIAQHQQNLYFDVEALAQGSAPVAAQVEILSRKIKAMVQRSVEEVLRNRRTVEMAVQTAEAYRQILTRVVFAEVIERLRYIKGRVEKPDDAKRFYEMLNNAVRTLARNGGDRPDPDYDVDVVPLDPSDSVIYGCAALYKPGTASSKAQTCIPMSKYGTNQLLSHDEALELLAHELGHHLSITKPLEGRPAGGLGSHDLQHSHIEGELLSRLRSFDYDWKTGRVTEKRQASSAAAPSQIIQPAAPQIILPPEGSWQAWVVRFLGIGRRRE